MCTLPMHANYDIKITLFPLFIMLIFDFRAANLKLLIGLFLLSQIIVAIPIVETYVLTSIVVTCKVRHYVLTLRVEWPV